MQIQDAIKTRLSIRRYANETIPDTDMEILLKALQLSPSANNAQNWEFVFVGDPDLKHNLIKACSSQRFVGDCAYLIAAVVDPAQKWHMVDITIALTNLTLQAVELGYGTCWIGAFDENQVKQLLKVPPQKKIVVCMTLGTPTGKHVPRSRKPIDSFVYRDQFGRSWNQR
ncbi:MAG: nitroreductase family protein [Desulfosarcinaceae bacterium]|nr:nitroreductase family protein [Desulfosarcinaceae bacterium]